MSRRPQTPEPETTDAQRDAERVYNLVLDLKRAKQEKNTAVAMHNEEIARVQAEIDEIINREPVVPDAVAPELAPE